jgi:hypothetical protein
MQSQMSSSRTTSKTVVCSDEMCVHVADSDEYVTKTFGSNKIWSLLPGARCLLPLMKDLLLCCETRSDVAENVVAFRH